MNNSTIWQPNEQRIRASAMHQFMKAQGFDCYDDLHIWSVDHPEEFWLAVCEACDIQFTSSPTNVLLRPESISDAGWFHGSTLNFAQHLLRHEDDADALIFRGENGRREALSHNQLRAAVAEMAGALRADGVGEGDRVAGLMPNCPEAVIAMLAAVSIGAVWSSCSPDFGRSGILDRFGQIDPKVLVAVNGYYYNGKICDTRETVAAVIEELPSVCRSVVVPFASELGTKVEADNCVAWGDYRVFDQVLEFTAVDFNHPLYIMFSSGTTGVPKCIVHGHGGTLLQQSKEHVLHTDVGPDDVLFYFTTCSWMMWNWLVCGLGTGATLLLFDGAPFFNKGRILWDIAELEGITIFGTSAKYISAQQNAGLRPIESHSMPALKTILSTGSPLAPESYDYVYQAIANDVLLASISGGTDILSCFALGNPILPVRRGELQCKGLGMATEIFDDAGKSIIDEQGELVCTRPFPSTPVGFWNDEQGARYHAAYFARFPGVWAHGDFAEITSAGGLIIHGRSDAVLNPGGVRIGTAEIYRQVEQMDAVVESIAVGQNWQDDVRVVLFVVLQDGVVLNDTLRDLIRTTIRQNTTPRHVPAVIVDVAEIPRTHSGKIVELAIRSVIHGEDVDNTDALANPEALEYFRNRPELQPNG